MKMRTRLCLRNVRHFQHRFLKMLHPVLLFCQLRPRTPTRPVETPDWHITSSQARAKHTFPSTIPVCVLIKIYRMQKYLLDSSQSSLLHKKTYVILLCLIRFLTEF